MNLRPMEPARDRAVEAALAAMPLALSTTWLTLEAAGAELGVDDERLLVRTPAATGHLWANALSVLDSSRVDEATHWYEAGLLDLPTVARPAFGLPARPDPAAWHHVPCPPLGDLALEWHPQHWVALQAQRVRPSGALPGGWRVEPVDTGRRWQQWAARDMLGGPGYASDWTALKRRRQDLGRARFFVGLAGDRLVASGGITLCEVGGRAVGRFEDIQTEAEHRRRGLASHLLLAAHEWALGQGADGSILVADADGEAIGLYEHLGFTIVDEAWMVLPRVVGGGDRTS